MTDIKNGWSCKIQHVRKTSFNVWSWNLGNWWSKKKISWSIWDLIKFIKLLVQIKKRINLFVLNEAEMQRKLITYIRKRWLSLFGCVVRREKLKDVTAGIGDWEIQWKKVLTALWSGMIRYQHTAIGDHKIWRSMITHACRQSTCVFAFLNGSSHVFASFYYWLICDLPYNSLPTEGN